MYHYTQVCISIHYPLVNILIGSCVLNTYWHYMSFIYYSLNRNYTRHWFAYIIFKTKSLFLAAFFFYRCYYGIVRILYTNFTLDLCNNRNRNAEEIGQPANTLFYRNKYLQVHRFFDKYATLENINHAYCCGLKQVRNKITHRFIAIYPWNSEYEISYLKRIQVRYCTALSHRVCIVVGILNGVTN